MILVILLSNCGTVEDKIVSSIDSEDYQKLEDIELILLDYEFSKDSSILEQASKQLDEILKSASYNKPYRARILGLMGEVEYYKNNMNRVRDYIKQIEAIFDGEERLYILKALLEKDQEQKITTLEQGIALATSNALIKLHLAMAYFSLSNFEKSVAYYDEALLELDEKYNEYYKNKRDLAYQFMKNPSLSVESADVIALDVLNISHVILFILKETSFFDRITMNQDINPELLLLKLKEADYIKVSELSLEDVCPRKDIAFLLFSILVYFENDPALATRYTERYTERGLKSPVPDIDAHAYFFNAALVLVEREIMSLPDGINFFPQRTVSGIEFTEILNNFKLNVTY